MLHGKRVIVLFLMSVFLVGCSKDIHATRFSTSTDHVLPGETQSPIPSEITIGTVQIDTETVATSVPGTGQTKVPQTVTDVSTAFALPIRSATKKCISIEPSLPPGLLSEGVLFIGDFTEKPGVAKLLTFDPQSAELNMLPDLPAYIFGDVSPNLLRLMYDHPAGNNNYETSIISSDGSIISSFPVDDSWSSINWLTDQQAIFGRIDGSPTSTEIVNVLSGERKTIAPDLPHFFDGYPGESWGFWKFVFDPSLSRIVYKQENTEGLPSLVLWDLENNQEMWRLEKPSVHFTKPAWSPDGNRLAVVAMNQLEDNFDRFELFIVNYDGQGAQWIDMKGYFPEALSARIKWSPDGRYIAIMTAMEQSPFLVLDTSTHQVMDYCILGGHANDPLLWSPDSTQVIIPVWETPSILIDLKREVAAQLVQDFHFVPVAWLVDSE